MIPHKPFPKIPRIENVTFEVTEKLDGTNGVVQVTDSLEVLVGSRNRWLDKHNDNHGFFNWVMEREDIFKGFGQGIYRGEFIGKGIQRTYGLLDKHFYLFDLSLEEKTSWAPDGSNIHIVPYLGWISLFEIEDIINYTGEHLTSEINRIYKSEGVMLYSRELDRYIKVIWDK